MLSIGTQHRGEEQKKQDLASKERGKGKESKGHRGGYRGRSIENKILGYSTKNEQSIELGGRFNYNKGRGSSIGGAYRFNNYGRGSHFSNMKCYYYGQLGHPTYRCPEKASSSQGEKKIAYPQEDFNNAKSQEINLDTKSGKNLLYKRILIKEPRKLECKKGRELLE